MNFSTENLPAWVPESLRSDPKKVAVLGALLLFLAVMVGRYLLKSGPSAAQAAPAAKPAIKKPADKPDAAPQMSSSSTRTWLKTPITSVGRNLFTIRPELFPSINTVEVVSAPVVPGFWETVEKSRSDQADQKKRRDVLVDNLQREAAKLRLQSTVMGPEPQAIIGGTLVKEGSVVASDGPGSTGGVQFRVLVIEARRVVVERQGIRLEIRMAQ
ncbi:MAG TPA: hypothetical protein VF624_04560 [Tepidisphaeraceae bacterium]|jgi:hypothetical protein